MMIVGACMTILLSFLMIVRALLLSGSQAALLGGLTGAGLVYVLAIVIILCARSLRVLRSRRLGVTAAVLCLVVSLSGLSGTIMSIILLVAAFSNVGGASALVALLALILGTVSLAQLINCAWGGVSTLRFIFRDDVGEAIRESLASEARTAATSATLVPDSCRRAALWQILATILVFFASRRLCRVSRLHVLETGPSAIPQGWAWHRDLFFPGVVPDERKRRGCRCS